MNKTNSNNVTHKKTLYYRHDLTTTTTYHHPDHLDPIIQGKVLEKHFQSNHEIQNRNQCRPARSVYRQPMI